jgi:glutathione synthase/RimK-type ligase-like ATP-grasp enzyme
MLYGLFPVPLLRIEFKRKKKWVVKKCTSISFNEIPSSHHEFLSQSFEEYCQKKRYKHFKSKKYQFDLAILLNPKEKTPPSNPVAIDKFVKAAEKIGINAQLIEKEEYNELAEYDALFIRETTYVNHHTYRFSRRAFSEGLVVVDDPVSILKCTNKVYLAELFNKHKISSPKCYILSKYNWKELIYQIELPCVLKLPDSAFSQGVVKVSDIAELKSTLVNFFKDSELIIAQEFVPTDYDWRIGVLDGEPLFACKYYMAKDHWQILDWQQDIPCEGGVDSLPINEVPENIINMSLKATKLIGNGLYGVDIKVIKGKPYIIEINDNPNIDHGFEDIFLGDELYLKIMNYFLKKIKISHGYK